MYQKQTVGNTKKEFKDAIYDIYTHETPKDKYNRICMLLSIKYRCSK